MELRQFILELRSRNVYRTAAVYLAGAWALLQVADVLFPVMGLPDWSITAVLILAAIGFPIALVISWLFELTPESEVDRGERHSAEGNLSAARIIELTLVLLLCGLVGYLYVGRLAPSSSDAPPAAEVTETSIAVLPFVNLSDDKQMEYLGDGLAEEILNLLAKLNELNVAARTSSFYFKDKDVEIQTIGQKLGVAHVLEGSVRHAGGRVRVTAQLIKSSDGFHVWSETYDREFSDMLEIQDDIAAEVVDQLQLLISSQSRGELSRSRKVDPLAYDYYLRGRDYLRKPRGEEALKYALHFFDKAIGTDAKFVDAYAGRCEALLGQYTVSLAQDQFKSAEKACQRALRMDRRSATVNIALGRLYEVSGQYDQALEEFQSALALGYSKVEAYLGLADTYRGEGDFTNAEANYRASLSIQPTYWRALMGMGGLLFESGRIAESVPYFMRVAELLPDSEFAFNNLGAAYSMQGDFAKATEAWQRSLELAPSALVYSNTGTLLFLQQRFVDALGMFQKAVELAPESYELWGYLADTYRQIEDSKGLAPPMYENAIRLATLHMEINPSDRDATALMAHYHAALGEREVALEMISRVRSQAYDSIYADYSLATAYCSLHLQEDGLDALEAALIRGFPKHIAAVDANLKGFQGVPRFEALVATKQP